MGIKENVDQMHNAVETLQNSDIVNQLPEEFADKVDESEKLLAEIKEDFKLLEDIKEAYGELDLENPTTEMVSAVCAVNHRLIEKLKKLPYLKDMEAFQDCLNTLQTVNDSLEELAKTVGEARGMVLALAAANHNPAAAVEVAWAGPAVAKKGIDFIRHIFPSLDTTDEMKEVENKVFSRIGGSTATGASIGGTIGWAGGPVGAAIGGALGGIIGSVAGLVYHAASGDA